MNNNLHPDARMDTEGCVVFPGGVFMHPLSFRDIFGEDAYQELLARPRVPSPYACCINGRSHEIIITDDLIGEQHDDIPNNPGADLD